MHEVIIIGSGAAGTAAALQLARNGICPLMVDVGLTNSQKIPKLSENLYKYRKKNDSFDLHIGDSYGSMENAISRIEKIAKLNSPIIKYVTDKSQNISPIEGNEFVAYQSFAFGGLANAWGCGLYRFNNDDIEAFPIKSEVLDPYFDILTDEIGICGMEDDLSKFFGSSKNLLPPLNFSNNFEKINKHYQLHKKRLNQEGFYLGRPRLGVLTVEKNGIKPCDYNNLEFWQDLPFIYTPARTLKKLINTGALNYRPGIIVKSWIETADGITLKGVDLESGEHHYFDCKKLILAAGVINTSKIVLESYRDYKTQLSLLENPILQIPLGLPLSIGRKLDVSAFGLTQLNLIWESHDQKLRLQGSMMELTSPMRAEFFNSLPFAASSNIRAIKYLLPALVVMQLFFPSKIQDPSWLSLRENGEVEIEGNPVRIELFRIRKLVNQLRTIGLWTHETLIKQPTLGNAVHYAGTLPMRNNPNQYQCYPNGRLFGTRCVYVADSSNFCTLPAKNMSFGMMANAMRVASSVLADL